MFAKGTGVDKGPERCRQSRGRFRPDPGRDHLRCERPNRPYRFCAAAEKPFNFMVGIKGKSFTVTALAAVGVKRISLATSLYRAAMTGLLPR